MHEYTECYLYYSCYADEPDPDIKNLYGQFYKEECGHLKKAAEMLEKYEGKTWQCLFPDGGDFPELLAFEGNIEYIRQVLQNTIKLTKDRENYVVVSKLSDKSDFKKYNGKVCKNPATVPSHEVIQTYIKRNGEDFRVETSEHPVEELRNRSVDNTSIAR